MDYNNLLITVGQAQKIAFDLFNIDGTARSLPGEIDSNFKVDSVDGKGYILKVSRPQENIAYLDFQQRVLQYAADHGRELIVPKVISDRWGNTISQFKDEYGQLRKVRLLTWISGRVWNGVNPQLDDLRLGLGKHCGKLTLALQGFDHPEAHREFEWDVAQGGWTTAHLSLFEAEKREIVSFFQDRFLRAQPTYSLLRKAVVHNDANDHNVIVSEDLVAPAVVSAIDFGDALHTQIINDLAVACAYAIMGHNDPLDAALPLVKGYHQEFALEEGELEHLYIAIAMRLVISVTKSAINKKKEPGNTY
ncbi:MAG TPA: phosphotransferase, partial [Arenibacter sp.]|nr:phosphotransferase [Arenibacter sp.]